MEKANDIGIYYIPVHTRCTNCGKCCGPMLITYNDYVRISKYLEDNDYAREVLRRKHKTTECVFRDDYLKRCAIYSVRPMICTLFGVAKDLICPNGNSAEIDGTKLLNFDRVPFCIQNEIDWGCEHEEV